VHSTDATRPGEMAC